MLPGAADSEIPVESATDALRKLANEKRRKRGLNTFIYPMPGDGACLLWALQAYAKAFNIPEWRGLSREKIVKYLRDHPAELRFLAEQVTFEELGLQRAPASGGHTTNQKDMLTDLEDAMTTATSAQSRPVSPKQLITRMKRPGGYLGIPAIHVAARMAERPIHVILVHADGETTEEVSECLTYGQLDGIPNATLSKQPVQLARMMDDHFEPLLPADEPAVFFDPDSAWLNTVRAVRLTNKSAGGSSEQFELRYGRDNRWKAISVELALKYIDSQNLAHAGLKEGQVSLVKNFLRSRNILDAEMPLTHIRARQQIFGQDTLCPSCAVAPASNAGVPLLRTSVAADGLLVRQCGSGARCRKFSSPQPVQWRFEFGRPTHRDSGMEWFGGTHSEIHGFCNSKNYQWDRDAQAAMSSFKEVIATANKEYLSSKLRAHYQAQKIRATQVLALAGLDVQEAKTSKMSTEYIADLAEKVFVAAAAVQTADRLLRLLPVTFADWGKKIVLTGGFRPQTVPLLDADGSTGIPFACATPAGRLRCGRGAVASALMVAGDQLSGEIAASWKAELDFAGLCEAVTQSLTPHWRIENSSVAGGIEMACQREYDRDTFVIIRLPTAIGFHIVVIDCNRGLIHDSAEDYCRRAPGTAFEWLETLTTCAGTAQTLTMKDLRVKIMVRYQLNSSRCNRKRKASLAVIGLPPMNSITPLTSIATAVTTAAQI